MRRSGRYVGLRSLVATALLAGVLAVVVSSSPVHAAGYDADCELLPDDAVTVADVTGWRDALSSGASGGIKRFNRVLEAFGVDTESGVSAMTVDQAEAVSAWLGNTRWDRIARTMAALEACAEADDGSGGGDGNPPPPTPAVSILGGSDVTEGGDATFTLTASPSPASALSVSVTVSQSGDFATAGTQTVTITSTGSATLTVGTDDDSTDEADGSVTATVDAGNGYTVGSSGSATVGVADNDVTPQDDDSSSACLPVDAVTVAEVSGWRDALDPVAAAAGVRRFNRVLESLGVDTGIEESAMSHLEAQSVYDRLQNTRWDRISRTLTAMWEDDCDAAPPPAGPEVSISGGSGVTEGGDAIFTVTANPAPTASLDVTVSVSQSGDFTSGAGTRTVTIPTGGSATLTVGTTNDSTDEPDGSVTATVDAGAGYTVSSTNGAATVGVEDDDDPPPNTPEISISGGSGVTEGGDVTFTVTASPAPAASLDVTVSVSQSGDFATAGTQTVTVPTGGSATLTVATTDDSADEADGSVTATVDAGSGYTVSSTSGSATVAVQDDDDPPPVPVPVVSVSGDSAVTEGGDVTFTVTANPAPTANLDVTVSVSQSGDFATAGSQTVTVPTGGSATLTVATTDDSSDEPDGSVTATVDSGSGYTVSSTAGSATVAVRDDDVAQQQKASVKSEINVKAGSGITEGEDAVFTITATPPPSSRLKVFISIRQDGRFLQSGGEDRFFWIPPSGSATLRESTIDDTAIEDDGSVTVYVGYLRGRYNVGPDWEATLAVADNDTKKVDSRPPRTDITWAEFWAPYEDLIAEAEEVRNDPVLKLSKQHTDRWDRVLLAFGREVADDKLQAMTFEEAERLRVNGNTLFKDFAPAIEKIEKEVAEHGPWPVNPGEAPTQTTAFPGHIAVTGAATSKTLTLTDYFSDPEGEDLTFTASISGTTMTATLNGADLTLALNTGLSRGGGDLTVTASDGQLTDTATAHVVVGCGRSATWSERSRFCTAAATSNSFSGGVDGDRPDTVDRTDPNNPINRYEDEHTAEVTVSEGESGRIRLLVYPDVLNDRDSGGNLSASNDGTCNMRGYLEFYGEDDTDFATNTTSTVTGTWNARVTGNGFTQTSGASNQQGNADMLTGTSGSQPGWGDATCGNGALTAHKARLVIIDYTLPADDGKPGTDLKGIKLVYRVLPAGVTSRELTHTAHEVMRVTIKDSISKVTHPAGSRTDLSAITINEGTGGDTGFTLSSDDRLVGYLAVAVDGAEPNVRPDLTTNSSNPQNGWWTVIAGGNRAPYFGNSAWVNLQNGVIPRWSSSADYDNADGVWHNDALWIRTGTGVYADGDEPGGSNDGWAPVTRTKDSVNALYEGGYAGSDSGAGRHAPAKIEAWSPTGDFPASFTGNIGGPTGEVVWNEHDKKLYIRNDKDLGVFTPVDDFEEQRVAAYRDNGPAMRMNLKLTGGGKWPWLDDQACRFAVYGGTRASPVTATCALNYNWANNGYHGPDQKIEFWWVETESYDVHSPVKHRTKLGEWTLRETRVGGSLGPSAHPGNYWIEFSNVNGSGFSATATQPLSESHPDYVNRGDHVSGYIVTNTNPVVAGGNNDRVVAVEVRRGTTVNSANAAFKQPLNEYVGRRQFTIDGQAHREFYLQASKTVPCNVSGFDYSCFGGEGNWQKVSGRNLWRVPINLVVHDDNYVGEKDRYYKFSVKDSTSGDNPILWVKEDDHLQITLKADLALNGRMHIHSHRASYQHYSFRLEERGSVDGETGWDQWDVTIERDWHGFASSYSLGDDTKGVDEHPGCPNGGAGWVRAVFENWDGLFYGVDFDPGPSPSDHNYQPDDADTKYSGWVQVCK